MALLEIDLCKQPNNFTLLEVRITLWVSITGNFFISKFIVFFYLSLEPKLLVIKFFSQCCEEKLHVFLQRFNGLKKRGTLIKVLNNAKRI